MDDEVIVRPDTVAEIIDKAAEYILACEATFVGADPHHRPLPQIKACGDLKIIAAWLELHPDVDRTIMDVLSSVPLGE